MKKNKKPDFHRVYQEHFTREGEEIATNTRPTSERVKLDHIPQRNQIFGDEFAQRTQTGRKE